MRGARGRMGLMAVDTQLGTGVNRSSHPCTMGYHLKSEAFILYCHTCVDYCYICCKNAFVLLIYFRLCRLKINDRVAIYAFILGPASLVKTMSAERSKQEMLASCYWSAWSHDQRRVFSSFPGSVFFQGQTIPFHSSAVPAYVLSLNIVLHLQVIMVDKHTLINMIKVLPRRIVRFKNCN
jgi:hypothetical protein